LDDRVDVDSEHDDALVARVAGPGGDVEVHVWPALEPDGDGPDGGRGARSTVRRARRLRAESGYPVLLAFHGWTDAGEVFGPLAAALGRRWTVVAPDAPGHGGTTWLPAPEFRFDDQIGTGLAVLDALPSLGGRRAPVVTLGHSMGAVAAIGVAVGRPRVVRHVVLEDPVGTKRRPARFQAGRRRAVESLQGLDEACRLKVARNEHPGWPEDELLPWTRAKAQVDVAHLRVPTDWGLPLADRLARVRCPVTIIRGDPARGGRVSAVAADRALAACRRSCEVIALDAGHSVRREARTRFVSALAAVLARYEP
jgi:pimeloyl-ACP methyl ester carboxylesterase